MATLELTDWDRRLLDRYLQFYRDLDNRDRTPSTPAQRHFVRVCRGELRPLTQHEVAYFRLKELEAKSRYPYGSVRVKVGKPRRSQESPLEVGHTPIGDSRLDAIAIVNVIEAAEFDNHYRANHKRLFENLKELYRKGRARASSLSSDAAIWISACLGDGSLRQEITTWLTERYGHLSNVYTKSIDGAYALHGLRAGANHVPPGAHRLLDGHALLEAWQRVCDALPNDTLLQEAHNYITSMWSDLVTPTGLPLVTLSADQYGDLKAIACGQLGIPTSWLNDILHWSPMDCVQALVPVIPAILAWSSDDAERYARLVGSLGIGTIIAANPLGVVVALAIVARGLHKCRGRAGYAEWALGIAKGGATSGAILAVSALIGGPAWIGLLAGTAVGVGVSRKTKDIKVKDIADYLATRMSDAVKVAR